MSYLTKFTCVGFNTSRKWDLDAVFGIRRKKNTRVSTYPTDPVSTPDPGLFISK